MTVGTSSERHAGLLSGYTRCGRRLRPLKLRGNRPCANGKTRTTPNNAEVTRAARLGLQLGSRGRNKAAPCVSDCPIQQRFPDGCLLREVRFDVAARCAASSAFCCHPDSRTAASFSPASGDSLSADGASFSVRVSARSLNRMIFVIFPTFRGKHFVVTCGY